MSKTSPLSFGFYNLGQIAIELNSINYLFTVDISTYGSRFRADISTLIIEGDSGTTRKSVLYFGEGKWLGLQNIEDSILALGGTEEDVQHVSEAYDDLIDENLPSLVVGGKCEGFIKQEYERWKIEHDDRQS